MTELSPRGVPSQWGNDNSDKYAEHTLLGFKFSTWNEEVMLAALSAPAPRGEGLQLLVTANVDHIVRLTQDAEFREAYRSSWKAVVDGMPVLIYARLRGAPIPGRLTGSDLFPKLLNKLSPDRHRLLFVCADEETAIKLNERVRELGFTDHLSITAPMGFEKNEAFGTWLTSLARKQQTTHLFLGLGAPKSEKWMSQHRHEMPDCYGLAFGAALQFYAGTKRRAPKIVSKIGLEFLWRVASEPKRLAKRYFIFSWPFVTAIIRDLAGKPIAGSEDPVIVQQQAEIEKRRAS
ncbi:N-acetylglucosaminyldiphosphoundecaprenol N-acetyl-beta-D-mannosaminyltransferase [Neorhizobium huautlense]|uniref:N-acetylglucosaminyldiphosphoundecaprenol N-acetyl-beta-D-mannosaminyltransferase n=1 Tax=Neorhizobium huautlense TaxID=67774 RepID=A0ABT9PRT4_9HYPH|nr:WecB/TagA/CpsF family glycosyltransferase [Neorhizobium huautlense]MDP9837164.1 N-acetylglucosaminyldiphosphoundecaprenol N-acetyl-beta-D-mannosaminyltransferase [Neorhizobium huautlense]